MTQILLTINIWVFLFFIVLCKVLYHNIELKSRKDVFERYGEILVMLDSIKELAYQKVFQDHVLTYSFSGFKLNKEELDKFQSIYIKTLFTFCGPSVRKDLERIHGDVDSICATLANDFIQRIKQDEANITGRMLESQANKTEGVENG